MSAFSTHLLRHAQAIALDPDLTEEARLAATNQALESLLSVRAPEPVASILAARVAAAHLIMMECLRRAMRCDVGAGVGVALRGKAALMPMVADSFVRSLEQTKGPEPYRDAILAWDALSDPVPPPGLDAEPDFSDQHDPMPGEPHAPSPLADQGLGEGDRGAGRGGVAPHPDPLPRGERGNVVWPYAMPGEAAVSAAIAALFSSRHDPMPGEKPAADRSGPLRNGNPRRDLRTLPCCGARTRAGLSCRQPAMRNGRCRMHGGASTGARTEAGRDVLRAKATTHGFHTAEGKHFFRLIHALQATARLLNQARNLEVAEIEGAEADLAAFPQPEAIPARVKAAAARERSVSSVAKGGADRSVVGGRRDPGPDGPPVVPCPVRRRHRGRGDRTDDRTRAGGSVPRQRWPRAESQRHRLRKVGSRGRSPP